MVISSDNTIFLIINIMYSLSFEMISFYNVGNFTFSSLICILILTVSACLTIHKLSLLRQLINRICVPKARINWSMPNEQWNVAINLPNCFLLLAFATMSYYLTPFVLSSFHYDLPNLTNFKEVDSFFKLPTLEPPSAATGPLDHPFPSNTINDVPDHRSSPNGQNQGHPTVNLGYEILQDQARGSQGKLRVAIFDWLEPSGKRLSELFTAKPYLYYEPTHATEQMVVKGQPRACVIKELMEETTLRGTNERGVWVNAFPQNNLGSDHFYVKSGHSDIVREGRRMFLKG